MLAEGLQRDVEQDKRLTGHDEKDRRHDELIEALQMENRHLQEKMAEMDAELSELIGRSKEYSTKKITYISVAVAAVSFILGIVHFFL